MCSHILVTKGQPKTPRGTRTRAALVAAARVVFERDGYIATRLTDITAEANCSIGTFYTYFDGKEEAFAAVMEAAKDDMLHPGMEHLPESAEPLDVISASNRAYFEAYRRNAGLMRLQEQVATIDEDFRKARKRRGDEFVERNARGIRTLQEAGLADPRLDPTMTSVALSSMVSRLAYTSFVLGGGYSVDELVETSSRIWANALRLDSGDGAAGA